MTLITVVPVASSYATVAGVSTRTIQAELDKWAAKTLDEARRLEPDEIAAHTVQGTGRAGPGVLTELERGAYDLVVLGARGRGPAQEGFLGSVNGYVHFHSKAPPAVGPRYGFGGAVETPALDAWPVSAPGGPVVCGRLGSVVLRSFPLVVRVVPEAGDGGGRNNSE